MTDQPTQEELQNMSPEELAALQKKNCIFCKIIKGEVPAKKVFEDEHTFAILDINPASKGHILLLTKEHYQVMPQIPDPVVMHLAKVTKSLSHVLLKALGARGTEVFIANGPAAGQRAPHFLLHLFPRSEGDGLPQVPENEVPEEKLLEVVKQLQDRLGASPQKTAQEPVEQPKRTESEKEQKKTAPQKQPAEEEKTAPLPEKRPPEETEQEQEEDTEEEKPSGSVDLDQISNLFT